LKHVVEGGEEEATDLFLAMWQRVKAIVPASSLFDFTETITDLRVIRIKGPHFIFQAQPQESLTAILNFVGLISS